MRNIDLDINIFFNFDVSIISSISVCEAKSLYLSTLNAAARSEMHKRYTLIFNKYAKL